MGYLRTQHGGKGWVNRAKLGWHQKFLCSSSVQYVVKQKLVKKQKKALVVVRGPLTCERQAEPLH